MRNPLDDLEHLKSERRRLNAEQRDIILMAREIQDKCLNDLPAVEWRDKIVDSLENLIVALAAQIEYINATVADLDEKFRELPPDIWEYIDWETLEIIDDDDEDDEDDEDDYEYDDEDFEDYEDDEDETYG